ncbi:hypothetical protein [Brevundimonas sp. UBA7534]|uniref:hypothetical protein n=1 Tax=Brevundimonas sp. UBA7534 TaxID=1946138 RepID=UPI0025C2E462|nr:hypothetical protein [Brevundimonas sp. UBA7534]
MTGFAGVTSGPQCSHIRPHQRARDGHCNLKTLVTNRQNVNEPAMRQHRGLVETAEAAPVL